MQNWKEASSSGRASAYILRTETDSKWDKKLISEEAINIGFTFTYAVCLLSVLIRFMNGNDFTFYV
jgi:hypothetical protein